MSSVLGNAANGFISYYPLKQGLKLRIIKLKKGITAFISYYPLKQGLKLAMRQIETTLRSNLYPTIH